MVSVSVSVRVSVTVSVSLGDNTVSMQSTHIQYSYWGIGVP